MDLKISLYPEPFQILGVNVGLSVIIAWAVLGVIILLLVLNRFLVIKRFKASPRGLQNLEEMAIENLFKFVKSKVGHHAADFVAPFALTFITYIFFTTVVELFGIPPATEDINCTLALGLFSFFMVNFIALKYAGFVGRLKNLAKPMAFMAPIRLMTDLITPFSMAIRLFANVLVGGVIMQMIYALVPIILPAAVASYFSFAHVAVQTFVFSLLFLIYISEAVGEVTE